MIYGLRLICSFSIAVALGASAASAAVEFDSAIKARKAVMSLYAWNLGQLGAMAKGEADYNAEAAATAAENIRILAAMNIGAAWPQGSDSTALPGKTRAKIEAWTTYPESAELGKQLVAAATAMTGAAGNGVEGIQANIGALGGACRACHEKFREAE